MADLDPNREDQQVEATPELKRLLGRVQNGCGLNIVENGVVVGRLQRVELPQQEDALAPWEVALEVGNAVPSSEWSKVPTDLAKNFDHYRYGHPRVE